MNFKNLNLQIKPAALIFLALVLALIWFYFFGIPYTRDNLRSTVSMKELLSVCIDVSQKAGKKVREIREEEKYNVNSLDTAVKGKTMEGVNELVTKGDLSSNRIMMYGIRKAFPDLKVVSEEKGAKITDFKDIYDANKFLPEVQSEIQAEDRVSLSDITVWVDPLDATQEYTDDLGQYVTTMVCVAVKGIATIGVIHFPFHKETDNSPATIWAWVGKPRKSPFHPLPSEPQSPSPRIVISRSHGGENALNGDSTEEFAKSKFGKDAHVERAGGAGYKVLSVLKGSSDIYLHNKEIKKWDVCAGNAILSAYNGKMTDLKGSTIDYAQSEHPVLKNGLLASMHKHDYYLSKCKTT